jgi:hypothetical protein
VNQGRVLPIGALFGSFVTAATPDEHPASPGTILLSLADGMDTTHDFLAVNV